MRQSRDIRAMRTRSPACMRSGTSPTKRSSGWTERMLNGTPVISRVVVQVLQERVRLRFDQTGVPLSIRSVQPLERFVGLVPESIDRGDRVRTAWIFRNQLTQCGV